MLITFLTVISWIYVCFYLLSIATSMYVFSQLTARQRQVASIDLNKFTTIGFLLSVAFLITKALT